MQWSLVLERLLALPNPIHSLLFVTKDLLRATFPAATQIQVATALVNILAKDSNEVREKLLPSLISVADEGLFDQLHEDLRIAITTAVCRFCSDNERPERVQALQESLRQNNVMTDSEIQVSFQNFSSAPAETRASSRRRKRRRVHGTAASDCENEVISEARRLFANEFLEPEAIPKMYCNFSEKDQCMVWQLLIDLAPLDLEKTVQVVAKLIDLPKLRQTARPRVLSMLTIHACLNQTINAGYLNLSSSSFGQLCLSSLHSSLRELRIAAGQCLQAFLRNDLPPQLKLHNRKTALEYLRALSERDVACEQETLVRAWGSLALACDDSELNLALLRLVEYLGHSNPLICSVAVSELEKLSVTRGQSAEEMFRPFWSSIAVSVVQDLHRKPQKAQQLCDLLGFQVNQLLVLTQQETIPSLVLTKRTDVLQRIAGARGNDSSIQDVCLQPRTNLASTLALLLVQPGSDAETFAAACLAEAAPGFRGTDIASLVKIDPILIGCHMLKYIGDLSESRKIQAHRAFQTFASIAERRAGQSKAYPKSQRTVAEFFDTHRLGIMAHFSEILENVQGNYPPSEKARCVRAIAEMIKINKEQVNAALPQIRAALQSAMDQSGLCDVAFAAWMDLLSVLDGEDIAHVVDQTFALILRHWPSVSAETQQAIHKVVGSLINTHNQVIRDNIMTVPCLSSIPLLSKFGAEIDRLKSNETNESHCKAFAKRLQDESRIVVFRALEELVPFLEKQQEFIHEAAVSEQPPTALSELLRALLDVTSKYSAENADAAGPCGKALGIIGCLDPNRLEVPRKRRRILMLSNFEKAGEVVDWAFVLLEDVLVKAFKSVTNARAQGYLAYTMQELLRFCEINDGTVLRPRASQAPSVYHKWLQMPEHIRITLTPFVNSRYIVTSNAPVNAPERDYPAFSASTSHASWLRSLVYDLMWKAKGENPQMVFPLLARVTRAHDIAIPHFVLPYAILNVVLGGTVAEVRGIADELLAVLGSKPTNDAERETVKLCSENVFTVLDYMSKWLQEKKKTLGDTKATAYRTGHSPSDFDEVKDMAQIDTVERFLSSVPAELIATQSVMCGSYARALFHWEKYIRQSRHLIPSAKPFQEGTEDEMLYDKLLDIYAQIDEPDGLEGLSAHLPILNEEQEAMQHARSGRWTAAQAWYESELANRPRNVDIEEKLLDCLRETGRYAPLLRYADSFINVRESEVDRQRLTTKLLPTIVEAQWMSGDLGAISRRLASGKAEPSTDFNIGVAKVLTAYREHRYEEVIALVPALRKLVTQGMTVACTSSVQASHDDLRRLHTLYEIEALRSVESSKAEEISATLEKRLSILGSYVADKQYVLGVRRAVMQSLPQTFDSLDLGASWLATAKLARQSGNAEFAYSAVLKALDCGDKGAKLEEARLLWRDGHQRHAIHALESAIKSGAFENLDASVLVESGRSSEQNYKQNMMSAKAHLLLAKWLDASGQSQSKDMTDKYQQAARSFQRWEKGHYYLGKHYQKLLEAEKVLPKEKQTHETLSGERTKLVIENLLRSVPFGNKYWHQTIPKILTLWLDLGMQTLNKPAREDATVFERRVKALQSCNKQLQKYFDRVQPYVFYSAMPQMISRITHPNPEVWKQLFNILSRIAAAHPSQALWSLLAVVKATDRVRVERGTEILNRLRDPKSRPKTADNLGVDLRVMIQQGQKLSDGLLQACEAPVEPRSSSASLSRDLGFNLKLAPIPLVVPIEATLTVSLPGGANMESIRRHKAFVQDKITIQAFSDDVVVLSSLQRPRKLTVRGSDGKQYGLLCKPKDDLRKDQRLMEFNGIINRALKRDAESSKRRLYIKTYAVTPLSEESGTIEWVEGIKPIRDILLNLYGRRGIRPNYTDLRNQLAEASTDPEHSHIFIEKILLKFPAILHEWFTELYPEPDAWFAARLRYARSAAVMSMTGNVLGLGDRHGENILLEESTGGVFHVDFNCLFDKGLTFEKPELVPFRLTHNMVDAMGPYGYDGPFRKSSELTMRLLQQSKDTLMTVLETFLYDPTTDFVGKKKRTTPGVPDTPQGILENVDGKLKGLPRGENVPLSVEGYVDALIKEATSPFCLASMYIGWCAFL